MNATTSATHSYLSYNTSSSISKGSIGGKDCRIALNTNNTYRAPVQRGSTPSMSRNSLNSRNGMVRASSMKNLGLFTTNFADSWDRKSPIDRASGSPNDLKETTTTSRIQQLVAADVNSRLAKSHARREKGGPPGSFSAYYSKGYTKSGGDLNAMRSSITKGRKSDDLKSSPPLSSKKKSSQLNAPSKSSAANAAAVEKDLGGLEEMNNSDRRNVVRRKSSSDTANAEPKSFINLSALRASLGRVAKPAEILTAFKSSNLPPDVLKYLEEDENDERGVRRSKSLTEKSTNTNKSVISLAALRCAIGRNGNASEPRTKNKSPSNDATSGAECIEKR